MSAVAVLCLAAVVVFGGAFVAAAYRRRWTWTGFVGVPSQGQESKTLWDWLQLLVIPVALAAVAFALNLAQSSREQRREDQRAALARQLALDQRREEALAAYMSQMSDLMRQRRLLTPGGVDARPIGRALTLNVLSRLDGARRGLVLQFLYESGLIESSPAIDLRGADLRGAQVRFDMRHVALDGADLRGADFLRGRLDNVTLRGAKLQGADFDQADLIGVRLEGADLTRSRLTFTRVRDSVLSDVCLTHARLAYTLVSGTTLAGATGHDVDFGNSYFDRTDFTGVDFNDINVAGAIFRNSRRPQIRENAAPPDFRCGEELEAERRKERRH